MERRDASVIPDLRKMVLENKGKLALESLWALYVSGGFDEDFAAQLLDHPNEDVRTWAIRLIGDGKKVSPGFRDRLVALARTEKSATVRCQLACSAKRPPGPDCLAIVRELLHRDEDADDPFIPMLLWWAIEDKAISDRDATLGLLDSAAWRAPIVRRFIVERLARRYVDEGGAADLKAVARLLATAPGQAETDLLLHGIDKSLEGRRLDKAPEELEKELLALREKRPNDLTLLRLAVRLGSADAYEQAVRRAGDAKAPDADRIALIDLLGQTAKPDCVPTLLQALTDAKTDAVRAAVLTAPAAVRRPAHFRRSAVALSEMVGRPQGAVQSLLCGRAASGLELLRAVDDGRIAEREVPLDQLRRLALLHDAAIDKLIAKHWGKITPATAGEKLTQIRNIGSTLSKGPGDRAAGKAIFTKSCAACHTLFGEGGKIGPDLTGADRKNRDWLLTQIVDPGAVIRQEFLAYIVNTKDGRTLNGLMVEQTPETITIVDAKNVRSVVRRDQIDNLKASPISLMPEKLLEPLEERQPARPVRLSARGRAVSHASGERGGVSPLIPHLVSDCMKNQGADAPRSPAGWINHDRTQPLRRARRQPHGGRQRQAGDAARGPRQRPGAHGRRPPPPWSATASSARGTCWKPLASPASWPPSAPLSLFPSVIPSPSPAPPSPSPGTPTTCSASRRPCASSAAPASRWRRSPP